MSKYTATYASHVRS